MNELANAPDHPEDNEDDLYDTKSETNHTSNPLGGRGQVAIRSLTLSAIGMAEVGKRRILPLLELSLLVLIPVALRQYMVFVGWRLAMRIFNGIKFYLHYARIIIFGLD
ncbi:hypothetical protein FWH09_02040 [Candidatus Saccharibacteria bacterium]|nr:hypothetical protein [Candidatus Saccharibacteria bacterium]